jgi:phosphoglycerate dehydrogenase-like enzyme
VTASDAAKPLVLLSAAPRQVEQLFRPATWSALTADFDVVLPDTPAAFDELLPRAFAVVGQFDLDEGRVARASSLRTVMNVEGNFLPNVDYAACFARGIHVLGCGPVFARPVAEFALALALDLCRGISREDRAFRAGTEDYERSTSDSILLQDAAVGLIGFGQIGRELRRLLVPFGCPVRAYDPWLPDSALREHAVQPAGLRETLESSSVLFVLATVTADSEKLIGAAELDALPPNARMVLVSRAAVVDFDALLDRVQAGRLVAAIDVWPAEPVAADSRARSLPGLVLSAHRAGGIPSAFLDIGDRVLDDLRLISDGLPPVRLQAAVPELVGRYRNRPVGPQA